MKRVPLLSLLFVLFSLSVFAQQPTITFTVDNSNIFYNDGTYVRWSSTDANSCTAAGGSYGWPGDKATSGSFYTGALTQTTTFYITASNSSNVSVTSSVTINVHYYGSLQVVSCNIASGGYYKIPVYFSGTNVVAIEATMQGCGIIFPKYNNTVNLNEWPYYDSSPLVSYDKTTSDNILHWGLASGSHLYDTFSPVTIKFYVPTTSIDTAYGFILFNSASFTDGSIEHSQYAPSTSFAEFTIFSGGTFGGENTLLDVVKALDLSTGQSGGDPKQNVYYDVDGIPGVTQSDAYLMMLRHFNQIYSYPVETGYDYWNNYGNASGEIIAQQLHDGVVLIFSDSLAACGNLNLKIPKGAWIQSGSEIFSSINKTSQVTKFGFIKNSSKNASIVIHGAKLEEVTVDGLINQGIPVMLKKNKVTTGVSENKTIPTSFMLAQNYPNPFNPTTTISYSIPATGVVTLQVYDILGKEVAVLVNEVKSAGAHEAKFGASGLSSGIYFYKIESGSFMETKKMFLMK